MMEFLKNPHGFGISIAVLTALLSYLYARTTESDKTAQNKVFWKTLVIGVISALVLTWLGYSRPEPVAIEPFNSDI